MRNSPIRPPHRAPLTGIHAPFADSAWVRASGPPRIACGRKIMTTTAIPKHRDRGMEGMVAKWYASSTGKSMDEFTKLAQGVAEELPRGSSVLEVAPGPGYFCMELAKFRRYSITGLDISRTFVDIARRNAAIAGVRVEFRQGNASGMPFADNSFDFLLCRAAFKNFGDPVRALQEMCRVLKPGGRGIIIDLKRNASPEVVSRHIDAMGLTWMNRLLTRMAFKGMLIKSAYTREEIDEMLWETSFSKTDVAENEMGFEITMIK